jgi:hypothetical protein
MFASSQIETLNNAIQNHLFDISAAWTDRPVHAESRPRPTSTWTPRSERISERISILKDAVQWAYTFDVITLRACGNLKSLLSDLEEAAGRAAAVRDLPECADRFARQQTACIDLVKRISTALRNTNAPVVSTRIA